jgi:hypothetical protein
MAADASPGAALVVTCPHCHRRFSAALISGGPERHRGFKCPHCKLFVAEGRVEDAALSRDPDA